MLCLTIEYEKEEWFIDESLDELRMVKDTQKRVKFTELNPLQLEDVLDALVQRAEEVQTITDTLETQRDVMDYMKEHKQTDVIIPKSTGLWGK